MSKLLTELKRKYRTPQEAMIALGLDSALLTNKEIDMSKTVLSRTAVRTSGALCAYMLPKLANDALPKFRAALAPGLKDLTRKNFVSRKAALVKLAKDAAMPNLAPEATASGGAGPDDVIMKVLSMIEGQSAEEPAEMDEQPAVVTEPSAGAAKATAMMKAAGMEDDAIAAVIAAMKPEAEDVPVEDEETEEEKKAREMKEAKDEKPDPEAGKPAMVSKTAMDAALVDVAKKTEASTMKRLQYIRAAEKAVAPLIGDVTVAMDSAEAIYRAALDHEDIDLTDVHPSAFPSLVKMRVEQKGQAAKPIHANDSAMLSERAAFEKANGITPSRIRNLGNV